MQWKITAAMAAGAAAVTAGGLMRSRYERDHFVTETETIVSDRIRKEKQLVFLSDLHDKEFGEENERLLREICRLQPEAVLIGGDTMITKPGRASLKVTGRLLKGLGKLGCPIYYANGNHEQRLRWEREEYEIQWREFQQLLETYGVIYLSDASAALGDDVAISGLNIEKRFYRNLLPDQLTKEEVESRLGKPDPQRFQILMAHSPLFFKAYREWGADLTLSGHFHGGTIRLPFLGGVMTPQYQFFCPWCGGTFEEKGRRMIVSRGLGTHSINLRIGNRPQIVLVRLKPMSDFSW